MQQHSKYSFEQLKMVHQNRKGSRGGHIREFLKSLNPLPKNQLSTTSSSLLSSHKVETKKMSLSKFRHALPCFSIIGLLQYEIQWCILGASCISKQPIKKVSGHKQQNGKHNMAVLRSYSKHPSRLFQKGKHWQTY